MRGFDVVSSVAASVLRFGIGARVAELGPRPEKRLEIYEFESCPFCRKAREALSLLDLDALVYPCPKRGERYRPALVERAGKAQFPFLVDPNAGVELYESDDIVAHLFDRYGSGEPPLPLRLGAVNDLSSILSGAPRATAGTWARASRLPQQTLELYSFEASPFCRLVRERLCELELPYVLHNVAKGSPSREAFIERSGKMQVPCLVDPNTGTSMFESADIVTYLEKTYAIA